MSERWLRPAKGNKSDRAHLITPDGMTRCGRVMGARALVQAEEPKCQVCVKKLVRWGARAVHSV